ncbi:MAG: hypothetical protein C0621_08280 [Desulfuromonas sp.]|nr:MAG: hypothetical protein C0621_08280 [Desulfuromonas sp.]
MAKVSGRCIALQGLRGCGESIDLFAIDDQFTGDIAGDKVNDESLRIGEGRVEAGLAGLQRKFGKDPFDGGR